MIDLHTHILPNMDDGAKSVEEAFSILHLLKEQGIHTVVCTPHFYPDRDHLDTFLKRRTEALETMKKSELTLIPASETLLHEGLFFYSDLRPLCIGNTNYILIELTFDKSWNKQLFQMLNKLIQYYNLIPIIAHIERYPAARRKWIKRLIRMGCLLQMNAGSLLNHKTGRKALAYIRHDYIDVLSSDCHNCKERKPNLADGLQFLEKRIHPTIRSTMEQNAESILAGIKLRENHNYYIL